MDDADVLSLTTVSGLIGLTQNNDTRREEMPV
jgi:hypothetical protein